MPILFRCWRRTTFSFSLQKIIKNNLSYSISLENYDFINFTDNEKLVVLLDPTNLTQLKRTGSFIKQSLEQTLNCFYFYCSIIVLPVFACNVIPFVHILVCVHNMFQYCSMVNEGSKWNKNMITNLWDKLHSLLFIYFFSCFLYDFQRNLQTKKRRDWNDLLYKKAY